MNWDNVNISKNELEAKQKEYIRMAMEMSKHAQSDSTADFSTVIINQENTVINEFNSGGINNSEIEQKTDVNISAVPQENSEAKEETAVIEADNAEADVNDSSQAVISDSTEALSDSEEEIPADIAMPDMSDSTDAVSENIMDTNDKGTAASAVFENVFMSEEDADIQIEKLTAAIEKSGTERNAPDFNSYIKNHNREFGCKNCRNNTMQMRGKGGAE